MEVVRAPLRAIKTEANRIRVRVNSLKRITKALAADDVQSHTHDRVELGYALHSINWMIDSNVIYLTQLGEQLTDFEHLCGDIELLPDSNQKIIIALQLAEEVYKTVEDVREQREDMTLSTYSALAMLHYFKTDTCS